jgi:hypothetical protein
MTLVTAGLIAEVVAAIAVVVSLWYLAVQLKQNTELERANLEVQLGLKWAEGHDNMIQNPGLAKAYDLAGRNWTELSDEYVRAYMWFVAKSFHVLEGMYRQYQRGLLTEDVWEPFDRYIFGALQIEAVLGWWQSDGALVSKEFKDHVESLIQSTDDARWRPVRTSDMVPNDTQAT